tara:strand:- start:417 stop:836 length:420 start_codon:yes stop_codon:yes gene_type:complete
MIKILEEEVNGLILTITASIPLRIRVSEKIKIIKSADIAELIKDRYDIVRTVKENQLSNSMRGNGKQKAQWDFQIRKKKPAPRKPAPKKAPVVKKLPPKEPVVEENLPTPDQEVSTKPSTKLSIRGRMSKIAKEKINKT